MLFREKRGAQQFAPPIKISLHKDYAFGGRESIGLHPDEVDSRAETPAASVGAIPCHSMVAGLEIAIGDCPDKASLSVIDNDLDMSGTRNSEGDSSAGRERVRIQTGKHEDVGNRQMFGALSAFIGLHDDVGRHGVV